MLRLNYNDNREIEKIIKNFNDADNDIIRSEVDRLMESTRLNPVTDAVRNYFPTTYTKQSCDYLEMDDMQYQDETIAVLDKLLLMRVIREHAIYIYLKRISYWEAE
ncbi:hypothetical protein ACGVWS_11775 [Enterobacteriaceae bacterium LUAb1]